VVPYSAIFVARSGQSTAFHCHFPQMVAVASKSPSCKQPVRLVGFSAPCADRLSAAVGIPRVSAIGLRDGAPHAKALLDYVQAHVAPISAPWLSPDPSQYQGGGDGGKERLEAGKHQKVILMSIASYTCCF
jgi:hypothetical protein